MAGSQPEVEQGSASQLDSPTQPVPSGDSLSSPKSTGNDVYEPPNRPIPVNVGGHRVQAAPHNGIVVDGATVNPTTPSKTVGGVRVALSNDGVVVGGNVIPPPQQSSQNVPPAVVNGHTLQVNWDSSGHSHLIVDGQPVVTNSGGPQVGNNKVSLMTDGRISVLPTTLPYVPLAQKNNPEIASSSSNQKLAPYRLPNGDVIVAGSTLAAAGAAMTIHGIPVSIVPGNGGMVVGHSTIQPAPTVPPAVGGVHGGIGIVMKGETFTPVGSNAVAHDGTTISQAGQSIALKDGKTASLVDGSLVIDSQTLPIPHGLPRADSSVSQVVVGGETFTPLDGGRAVFGGATLSKLGQTVSLKNGQVATLKNGAIVVGSQTIPLPDPTLSIIYQTNAVIVDGQTFKQAGTTGIAVDGTTLSKSGQSVTLSDGKVATLVDGALLLGTQVIPIPENHKPGVGYWIAEGFTKGEFSTLSDGRLVLNSTTLTPGGPAVTFSDGEIVSLEASSSVSSSGILPLSMRFSGTATPQAVASASATNMQIPTVTSTPAGSSPTGDSALGLASGNGDKMGTAADRLRAPFFPILLSIGFVNGFLTFMIGLI